jgi:hypothetical protein
MIKVIDGVLFEVYADEVLEFGNREVTFGYESESAFGTLRMNTCNDTGKLQVDNIHRRDENNKILMHVCDLLDLNYKDILREA